MQNLLNCPKCGNHFTLLEQVVGKCEKCLHSVTFLGNKIEVAAPSQPETTLNLLQTVQ